MEMPMDGLKMKALLVTLFAVVLVTFMTNVNAQCQQPRMVAPG